MMEREVVIKIEGLRKRYRLGAIGGGTLRGDLQSWWARVRGKEDPNTRVGTPVYNVNKKNATFMALDGIDLKVYKGDTLGIIGGNGAGKSTMLKVLSRVTAPTEGTLSIKGRISSMLEVGTGFHPELTGRENIYLNGAILGMSRAEVSRKIDDIIEFSECAQFIDTPVKRYSSGMYVKLAFSVAAHLDSEILVMDEVLAVGDMKFQQKCLGKMGDVADREGRTVLYVSHNMSTIRRLCNRCVVLSHGRIIYDGEVDEAIEIYMDSVGKLTTYQEFDGFKRVAIASRAIAFKSLRILDRDEAAFTGKDPITCEVVYDVKKDIDALRFRLEFMYADDTMAGTAFSDRPVSVSAGKAQRVRFKCDMRYLAPGKYTAVLVAYETNAFGTEQIIDRVHPAMVFRIEEHNDADNIVWVHSYFGHVNFPKLEITE